MPGKFHGRRSLVGYSPWGRKESDTTERPHFPFHSQQEHLTQGLPRWLSGRESACNAADMDWVPDREDPLEEQMATYSSILAWEVRWTEEPGGLHTVHWVTKS